MCRHLYRPLRVVKCNFDDDDDDDDDDTHQYHMLISSLNTTYQYHMCIVVKTVLLYHRQHSLLNHKHLLSHT